MIRRSDGDSDEEIVGDVRKYCQIGGNGVTPPPHQSSSTRTPAAADRGAAARRGLSTAGKLRQTNRFNNNNNNNDDKDEEEQEANNRVTADGGDAALVLPVFRTPEIVRKTRDSPAVFSRPRVDDGVVDSITRSFVGENPLLSQVLSQFTNAASAPKKLQGSRPSLLEGRRSMQAGSLRKIQTLKKPPTATAAVTVTAASVVRPPLTSTARPSLRKCRQKDASQPLQPPSSCLSSSTFVTASNGGGPVSEEDDDDEEENEDGVVGGGGGGGADGDDEARALSASSRLYDDFVDVTQVGVGEFGSVYRCRHRLDGCTYAVKCSRKPITMDRECLKELQVHALLSKHPNVVRYYSSWCEDGYVYVQTEFCDGGSLRDLLAAAAAGDVDETKQQRTPESARSASTGSFAVPSAPAPHHVSHQAALSAGGAAAGSKKRRRSAVKSGTADGGQGQGRHPTAPRRGLSEDVVLAVGRDVARGLAYMHAVNLAHLDIKPDNVFVSHDFFGDGLYAAAAPFSAPAAISAAGTGAGTLGSHVAYGALFRDGRPSSRRSFTASPSPLLGSPPPLGMTTTGAASASASTVKMPPLSFGHSPSPSVDLNQEPSVVYRIGDFGRAALLNCTSIDEGDVRYVSLEALQDRGVDLVKVDVYALGVTLYELATGAALPVSGDAWRALRVNGFPAVPDFSPTFNSLVQAMTDPLPSNRPNAEEVLHVLTEMIEGPRVPALNLEMSPSPTLDDPEDQVMESPDKAPSNKIPSRGDNHRKKLDVKRSIHGN